MRQHKTRMTCVLLALCICIFLPTPMAYAISISVGAPIEAQPLPEETAQTQTPSDFPVADVTLSWENPVMSYRWHKDETGNYSMYPTAVCIPVSLLNRTACADADVTVSCATPPDSELITFFGGIDRASIGISVTPDGPICSELTFAAISGACAEAGQSENTLVFYYRILPDADIQLPPENIDGVQSNRLQSAISCTVTAVTPHQHEEKGNER